MSKASLVAITTMLWSAGIGIGAGLVYELNRPLPSVPIDTQAPAPILVQSTAPPPQDVQTLVMPDLTVHASVAPPVRPRAPLRCSAWLPLQQGSGSVQVCE